MEKIGVREAKIHLSRLIEDVLDGKEIIITNHNKPVARLCPVDDNSLTLKERIARLEREGIISPSRPAEEHLLPLPLPVSDDIGQKYLQEDRNG